MTVTARRFEFWRLLWRLWSPTWQFAPETYARSALSFGNPDFVDVVIQSYRHRYGYVVGDPALEHIEALLAHQPPISVPTIVLDGADDGVSAVQVTDRAAPHFSGRYERRVIPAAGHNLPQEAPTAVIDAVLALIARGTSRGRVNHWRLSHTDRGTLAAPQGARSRHSDGTVVPTD